MHQSKLLKVLLQLSLPHEDYVVFGGGCLAVRGIRETDDIDLFVSDELYERFKAEGWDERTEPWEHPWLTMTFDSVVVEAYRRFDSGTWQPKFEAYLKHPEVIDGYNFMPLDDLYTWKAATRRPKDLRDLELIDEYKSKEGQSND